MEGNKHITLSIVIPIYNVERYLVQCIESITTQLSERNEVEVILVNDCSPDGCGDIVEKYVKMYDCMKSITHPANEGLSIARNTGINAASGDWLWFIDSDDWIEQDSLSTLLTGIEEHQDCDVICIQKNNIHQEYSVINDIIPHSMYMNGKQYLQSKLQKSVAAKFIIKRHFLLDNRLLFYPHILHEDVLYCYMMLYDSDRIFVSNKPLYVKRCVRPGSIMHTLGLNNANDLILIHRELMKFSDCMVKEEDKEWFFKLSFGCIRNAYCMIYKDTYDYRAFQKKNKKYIEDVCGKALHYRGFRFKMKSLMFKYVPRCVARIENARSSFRSVVSVSK